MLNNQIPAFIDRLKDEASEVEKCVDLFYELQRRAGPVAETAILLKYDKPKLHALLKKRLRPNPGLAMLFEISMDYHQAKAKLR